MERPAPVVLLPGLMGSRRYWRTTIERLRDERRVAALDLPGFGIAAPAGPGFDVRAAGDALIATWQLLGFSRPVLVGHSFGGSLALDIAARRPSEVAGLVLIATTGLSPASAWPAWRRRRLVPVAEAGLRRLRWWESAAARSPALRRAIFGRLAVDPAALRSRDVRDMLRGAAEARATRAAIEALGGLDQREQLARLALPVALIWGDADPVAPYADALTARALAPDAHLETLPGAGHVPMLEAPEAFAAALLRALGTM